MEQHGVISGVGGIRYLLTKYEHTVINQCIQRSESDATNYQLFGTT